MAAFWDIAPCSFVEVNRRFSGAYFLYKHRPDNAGTTHSEKSIYFNETSLRSVPKGYNILINFFGTY
jgi:hypothetical protein